jgi:hypothetical protein
MSSFDVIISCFSVLFILRRQGTEDRSRKDPSGVVGLSGGVQGTAGYRGDYWTAVGTSDRLFCYTQTENVGHFEY